MYRCVCVCVCVCLFNFVGVCVPVYAGMCMRSCVIFGAFVCLCMSAVSLYRLNHTGCSKQSHYECTVSSAIGSSGSTSSSSGSTSSSSSGSSSSSITSKPNALTLRYITLCGSCHVSCVHTHTAQGRRDLFFFHLVFDTRNSICSFARLQYIF